LSSRKSLISQSTADSVRVYDLDLVRDLVGKVDLGDMAFLELVGRLPTPEQSVMTNAVLVTLVEHGLTPSVLAARLTYFGSPETLQGALASGLLGLGSVFVGSMEGAAKLVQEGLASQDPEFPRRTAERHFQESKRIPGLGHSLHRQEDPRTERLFALATETRIAGPGVALMLEIAGCAQEVFNRRLPINATGAIGAVATDLGIPWQLCRGLGVVARSVGLLGHIREEMDRPLAPEIVRWAEDG
jgi:citrate synthase